MGDGVPGERSLLAGVETGVPGVPMDMPRKFSTISNRAKGPRILLEMRTFDETILSADGTTGEGVL